MGNGLDRYSLAGLGHKGRDLLLATYVGLASSVEGAEVIEREDWTLCLGPPEVKFCNFAAKFDIKSDGSFRELLQIARSRSTPEEGCCVTFMVCGEDQPSDLAFRLALAGFGSRYELHHFVWSPQWPPAPAEPALRLKEATLLRERVKAAQFMAYQFFPHRSKRDREPMVEATVHSGHRLFYLQDLPGRLTGAMMISSTNEANGLYNVCVRGGNRGRGIGRRLVRSAQELAKAEGRPLYLQCTDDLMSWYEQLGFTELGLIVSVYEDSNSAELYSSSQRIEVTPRG
jgi:ribosomal protein S18 acetylase RimI-like enzyme